MCTERRPMDCQSNVIGDGIRGEVRVIKDQLKHLS